MGKKNRISEQTETPRQDAFDAAWAKYSSLVPPDELSALEESLIRPLSPAIRINTMKMQIADVPILAQRYGWSIEPVPFCKEGFRLNREAIPGLSAEHNAGMFYIQDSASMLPCSLFPEADILASPLILDMAASPGGKTTHLVCRSNDNGLILANDSSLSRISALKNVLKNWGGVNQAILNFSGEFFGRWFPDTFDLILLDAPCSMQSLRSIDSHPMRPITEREEAALAQRQTALLDSALHALRPGGSLVYSTCTLSPDEDEAVVDQMIQRFGAKVHVVNAHQQLPFPAPGLTQNGSTTFDPSLNGTVRLWPHRYETAGFYAALIQKLDSFGGEIETPPFRKWERSGFSEIDKNKANRLIHWCREQTGIDLEEILDNNQFQLWQREAEIWMIPLRFTENFSTIPAKSAGCRIVQEKSAGLLPDNDWISRHYHHVQGERVQLNEVDAKKWSNGEELPFEKKTLSKGTVVFLEDKHGIFLGCGLVSGTRIRNLRK